MNANERKYTPNTKHHSRLFAFICGQLFLTLFPGTP